jgi:hypothetical protein
VANDRKVVLVTRHTRIEELWHALTICRMYSRQPPLSSRMAAAIPFPRISMTAVNRATATPFGGGDADHGMGRGAARGASQPDARI